jgi:predicted porin
LKGIWQIEQAIEIDTGNEDATFSNRNSFLGLAGGFGEVKLGHMDTIYKEYGQQTSMFGLTSGNFISPSNVLSQIGIGNSTNARFHERATNTIQYQTPEIAGVQAGLQYAPDENRNDAITGTDKISAGKNVQGTGLNADLWSTGVKYEAGPLYLSAQYELHRDFFGGSSNVATALKNGTGSGSSTSPFIAAAGAHSRDTGMRLSAQYKLGNHTIGGDIARLKYHETGQTAAGKFEEYHHVTWGISLESKWGGPWRTAFEWVRGNKGSCTLTGGVTCTTDGLTGDLYAAGLAYDLDKNTFLYALAAQLRNGDSARYDNWAASSPARGADVTQAALGMAYKF